MQIGRSLTGACVHAQVMQDTNAFPQAYSLEAPKGHPSLQGQPSLRIQVRWPCMASPAQ